MEKRVKQISEKKRRKLSALVASIAGAFLFILGLMVSQIPDATVNNSAI